MKKEELIINYEPCILVGLITFGQNEFQTKEYIDELEFLAQTAGAKVEKKFIQKLDMPNRKTYVGTGKIDEIACYIEEHEIKLVIFDDELSASQFRNVENILKIRVLDRTNLILDIFATRAKTAHAKTQVELAQYQYLLPRLTGMWTHLERQRGGIGMRGPGEKEIETDRRIIREKISKLKNDLLRIDKQKTLQRKNRQQYVRVALVGYTNVGKSTLMNIISKSNVFAENKLFATLDTTVRKVVFQNLPFLLADTVGFIRKLPHHLIESFKSTLDELQEADILLHVVDISHPNFEDQINIVNNTLKDLNAGDKKSFLIFNKIDNFTYIKKDDDDLTEFKRENYSLEDLKQMWIAKNENKSFFISAQKKINIDELKNILYQEIKLIHAKRFPYNNFLY